MPISEPSQWRAWLDRMAGADGVLDRLADSGDPQARAEAHRLLFAILATGYQTAFADPDHPDFVPSVSNILNTVGVNPDFIYGAARIDGSGVYRLSGTRGDGVFVFLDLVAGGLGPMEDLGPSVGMIDLDACTLGPDGAFDILLGGERPKDGAGDWFPLDPRAVTIGLRHAYYDWGAGRDLRIAIERVDRRVGGGPMPAAEIAHRLDRLSAFVERYAAFALGYGQRQRTQGFVNRLEYDDWAGRGGVAGQHYYQGIFRLEPGEAMIIDTAVPDPVRYWNVQLNDPLWNTIDWINHQSSLNAAQARLDRDGRFRAVIALDDPGVPNWLDPAGRDEGSLMLRWTGASSGPEPTLRIVPAAELRSHLPGDTPLVTPAQRDETIRRRRRGAQWRRRW
ncbi:hypothetical protein [Sphingomonas bisphenolicum]|uniref:DUF1214 domain-containing protein n=1 Tax=Sphingomonas bisphenolicum TaxID=296544 RepID=A0ABN5WGU7_9SPHN|nr:hypothetical protein [Sphingomonas bisphenolicum]BBF71472.1 hypothetical protein SBA_ch2_0050 [Sphingomonas bisphenolicum]